MNQLIPLALFAALFAVVLQFIPDEARNETSTPDCPPHCLADLRPLHADYDPLRPASLGTSQPKAKQTVPRAIIAPSIQSAAPIPRAIIVLDEPPPVPKIPRAILVDEQFAALGSQPR